MHKSSRAGALSGVWVFLVLFLTAGVGIGFLMLKPRIAVEDVKAAIDASIPPGSSLQTVQDWFSARYGGPVELIGVEGKRGIRAWIRRAGPRLAIVGWRIRVEFFFDEKDCLVYYTARKESPVS